MKVADDTFDRDSECEWVNIAVYYVLDGQLGYGQLGTLHTAGIMHMLLFSPDAPWGANITISYLPLPPIWCVSIRNAHTAGIMHMLLFSPDAPWGANITYLSSVYQL